MGRIITAGLAGGIALFMWGFVYWTILGPSLLPQKPIADEADLTRTLFSNLPETGVYWFPPPVTIPDDATEEEKATLNADFEGRYTSGPHGYIVYDKNEAQRGPMEPIMLATGVGINVLSSMIVAAMLACAIAGSGMGYIRRVLFVFGFGVFLASASHLVSWNFMYHPTEFMLFQVGDAAGGWLLTGIVIAALVQPKQAAPAG